MNKAAIVTGGFGVLGRAVVDELLAQGYAVAAVDLAPAPSESPATMAVGGVDLTDPAAVDAAYAAIKAKLGAVTALVNVAGGFVWQLVEGGDLANWDAMYRINLRTAVVSSHAALKVLGAGAAIVNIGAAGAVNPAAGMAPYAASKAGVRALTESLAEELRGSKIRVNAVLPTIIDTPTNRRDMPDADPAAWITPQAAAKVIAFLLSSAASPITGASIPLSLGQ